VNWNGFASEPLELVSPHGLYVYELTVDWLASVIFDVDPRPSL
jgi:hypothetical protein